MHKKRCWWVSGKEAQDDFSGQACCYQLVWKQMEPVVRQTWVRASGGKRRENGNLAGFWRPVEGSQCQALFPATTHEGCHALTHRSPGTSVSILLPPPSSSPCNPACQEQRDGKLGALSRSFGLWSISLTQQVGKWNSVVLMPRSDLSWAWVVSEHIPVFRAGLRSFTEGPQMKKSSENQKVRHKSTWIQVQDKRY